MKMLMNKNGNFQNKSFITGLVLMAGLTVFSTCNAQSIVGKWQRNMTVVYTTNKATGKQVPLSPEKQKQYDEAVASNGYVEYLEFKSDNTYTSTVSAGGEKKVHSEKYSITGNVLNMNIPLVNGEKTIIYIESLTATSMLWDLEFMNKKTGVGYKRL